MREKGRNGLASGVCMAAALLLVGSAPAAASAPDSGPITQRFLLSFHACDTATANCLVPSNHQVQLAQSNDGASWSLVPGWEPYTGSVPDVIRRKKTIYIYTPGFVARYNVKKDSWKPPKPVTLKRSTGFVDPSLIVKGKKLVLFFLESSPAGGDPAGCAPGEASCTKHFRSATEVKDSDGTKFKANSGDRVAVTIGPTPPDTASDPDIFFDGSNYYLYISRGPSIDVYTSSSLKGSYSLVSTLPNGRLSSLTGGIGSGYFDEPSNAYWTFAHVQMGGAAIIRRAVHPGFTSQLVESNWTPVVTGPIIGRPATTTVESPGFARNAPRP